MFTALYENKKMLWDWPLKMDKCFLNVKIVCEHEELSFMEKFKTT
jgi:hypothetical protein